MESRSKIVPDEHSQRQSSLRRLRRSASREPWSVAVSGARVTMDRNSSIAYDAREHRFVNTNSASDQAARCSPVAANGDRRPSAPPNRCVRVTGRRSLRMRARLLHPATRARTSMPASRTMGLRLRRRASTGGLGRSGGSSGGSVFQPRRVHRHRQASTAAPRCARRLALPESSGGTLRTRRPPLTDMSDLWAKFPISRGAGPQDS